MNGFIKMNKELKKEMIKEAKEYDRTAYCGHFAGEDPSYHFEVGHDGCIENLTKKIERRTLCCR